MLYLTNSFFPIRYASAISPQIIPNVRNTMSNLEYTMNITIDTIIPIIRVNKNRTPLSPRCFTSYTIIVLVCASKDTPTPKPAMLIRNCISP